MVSIDVLYENYEYIISEVVEAEWMQNHLEGNGVLSITVVQTNESQGDKIFHYVKAVRKIRKIHIAIV